MNYLRNPEVQREIFAFSLLCLAGILCGICRGDMFEVIAAAVLGVLFVLVHIVFSYRRYKRIARLTADINRFLHGYDKLQIHGQQEGELSLLENEIFKMTHKLKNQSELLQKDKVYLADSIADISHQIRTPLTAMNLIVSRLSTGQLKEEKKKQLIQELDALLMHIDWLIQSLLKISKLDAGTIQMQHSSVSVQELIREASETLEIPMELREQTLEILCDSETDFRGDKKWMKEALINILKNCMEHTPMGGTICIRAEKNPLYTEIVVQDNGPGIADEDLPHLFERFYKGKNSSDKSVGIGLALAKMIIKKQSGVISAANRIENGKVAGARFEIRFYQETV